MRQQFILFIPLLLIFLLIGNNATAQPQVTLSFNADYITHTISPDIYGVNLATEAQANSMRLPINRWGGNALTRYNWQIDAYNSGNYWYYENLNNYDPGTLPAGSSADRFVWQNKRTNTDTLIQVPMMGWVVKDRSEGCGFSQAKYGTQTESDSEWRPDCGNGISAETNQFITISDPNDTSKQVDSSFVGDWVQHLVSQHGNAASGGVKYYTLDNEPMIWFNNHGDVRKAYTGYAEVRDRAFSYGAAIKAADPTAKVTGPTLWGYPSYFNSTRDIYTEGSNPDHDQYGDFVPWYLDEMRQFEQANGYRLLDYLDVHYYPQGWFQMPDGRWESVSAGPAGDDAAQALRLRSTRDLWDPSYTAESWLNANTYALPRLRDWIDAHYPGTKLSISEYSWGAADDMNGALAQAEVLGIFGRERVDMAMLWPATPEAIAPGTPLDHVFRLFRNYDSAGSTFGNQSLQSYSSDRGQLTIYATQQNSNKVTVMVINKTKSDITTPISLNGIRSFYGNARRFRYSRANTNAIIASTFTPNAWSIDDTLPAESITLYELTLSGSSPTAVAVAGSAFASNTAQHAIPRAALLLALTLTAVTATQRRRN